MKIFTSRGALLLTRTISTTERADYLDMEYAAQLGSLLPTSSADALEEILIVNATDLLSRARLLGYYWKNYGTSHSDQPDSMQQNRRATHILWFIENAPDCVFAGDFYLSCNPVSDGENYIRITSAWKNRIETHLRCTQSRVNYALCVFEHDAKLAINILQDVTRIDKYNEWALTLLPMLGVETNRTLPIELKESKLTSKVVVSSQSKRLINMCLGHSRVSMATIVTQELILSQHDTDVWARLDIMRWCQINLRRANKLGFNPSVLQRLHRHVLWVLKYIPDLNLSDYLVLTSDFSGGIKIPDLYYQKTKLAFLKALEECVDGFVVLSNWMRFFITNIGVAETKAFYFSLRSWKNLDRKSRQKLTRALNWVDPVKSVFELNLQLNTVAIHIEHEVHPPDLTHTELEAWADELNLTHAEYEGFNYSLDEAVNLQKCVAVFDQDLISTARLYGCLKKFKHMLDKDQVQLLKELIQWIIQHIPASNLASTILDCDHDYTDLLRSSWLKTLSDNPNNNLIATNAANSLFSSDKNTAISITEAVLKRDPDNVYAASMQRQLCYAQGEGFSKFAFQDLAFESYCDRLIHNFVEQENKELTELLDALQPYIFSLLKALRIPLVTLRTNEQALLINPNDPILRLEILSWCFQNQLNRMVYCTTNPELARLETLHVLWLLENTPHADLYFYLRDRGSFGMGCYSKILEKAVKVQRKRYDKSVGKYRPEYPRKKKPNDTA